MKLIKEINGLNTDYETLRKDLEKIERIFFKEYCLMNGSEMRTRQYDTLHQFREYVEDCKKQIKEFMHQVSVQNYLIPHQKTSGSINNIRKKISQAQVNYVKPLNDVVAREKRLKTNKLNILLDIGQQIENKYPGLIPKVVDSQKSSFSFSCGLFNMHYLRRKTAPTGLRAIAELFALYDFNLQDSRIYFKPTGRAISHTQVNYLLAQVLNIACDRLMIGQADPGLLQKASMGLIEKKDGISGNSMYQVNQDWLKRFQRQQSWSKLKMNRQRLIVKGVDWHRHTDINRPPGIDQIKQAMGCLHNTQTGILRKRSSKVHDLYKKIATHASLTLCDALQWEQIYTYNSFAQREFMQTSDRDDILLSCMGRPFCNQS